MGILTLSIPSNEIAKLPNLLREIGCEVKSTAPSPQEADGIGGVIMGYTCTMNTGARAFVLCNKPKHLGPYDAIVSIRPAHLSIWKMRIESLSSKNRIHFTETRCDMSRFEDLELLTKWA